MEVVLATPWFSSAFFCSWLAAEKHRPTVQWFLVGADFGVVALLALIVAPARPADPVSRKDP